MHTLLRDLLLTFSGPDPTHGAAGLDSLLDADQPMGRVIGDEGEGVLLRTLTDQIPDFLFVKDVACRFVVANRAIARAYGREPNDLIGLTDNDLHPSERAAAFIEVEQAIIASGIPMFNMEETFPDSAGVQRWYSTTKVPLRSREGMTVGLLGISRDITERKRLEDFAQRQSTILEMIAKNAPLSSVLNELIALVEAQLDGVVVSVLRFDPEAGCLRHGAAPSLPEAYCRAIDGVAIGPKAGSCGTAAHRREAAAVADIQTDPLWQEYKGLAAALGLCSCWSTPILLHDGAVLGTFAMYSRTVRTPNANESGLIQAATRIAGIAMERHRSEERLVKMAHFDALTLLPNRRLCISHLQAALAGRGANTGVALLYIDLDGFKQVNDAHGHCVGDTFLQEVAERLRATVAPQHHISRLAGDEFAVIQTLSKTGAADEAARLASAIITALGRPYEVEGHHVVAGATVGIALADADDRDPEALLRRADFALYQGKGEERGCLRFFDPEMDVRAEQRRTLEIDLRHALEAGEFELYYQPQIDLRRGEICGFEALLRWNHPERGVVGPQAFISVAEEMGLIVPIGDWVLRDACARAAQWPSHIKVAVNLSPVQFRHRGLFQSVAAALTAAGISPGRLELEITESVILLDSDANLSLLRRLRALGVKISLDDFGTGYSSMSYLRSFPFTKIKIDRSFVRDLEVNPDCLAIVRAVSRLAADLGMLTTAEGIETRRQRELLRSEGCDEGQGFLFSPPVPAAQVAGMFTSMTPITAAA